MDKEPQQSNSSLSRSLRRSGLKLRSLGSNHKDLYMVLAALKDLSAHSKELSKSWSEASKDLNKWGSKDENRAIEDVFKHVGDLLSFYAEIQREQTENILQFRKHFEKILEGERDLESQRNKVENAQNKESKLRKELKKLNKNNTENNELKKELKKKLDKAEREADLEQNKTTDLSSEHEIVKLLLIKKGLTNFSDNFGDASRKSQIIFDSTREITEGLPDIDSDTRDIQDIRYQGGAQALQISMNAKDKLVNYHRGEDNYPPPSYYQQPAENPFYSSPQPPQPQSLPYVDERFAASPPNPFYDTPSPTQFNGHRRSLPPQMYPPLANGFQPPTQRNYHQQRSISSSSLQQDFQKMGI